MFTLLCLQAESASLIGQAIQQNPAFLTLRKIEVRLKNCALMHCSCLSSMTWDDRLIDWHLTHCMSAGCTGDCRHDSNCQ